MALTVYAMATMVFYIGGLGIFNFITRKNAAVKRQVSLDYYKIYDAKNQEIPEFVIRMGRHFDNQFQLPPLFMISCLVSFQVPVNDLWIAILAWTFVVSRFVHTCIHLGSNKVILRAQAYGLGLLSVVLMWVLITLQLLTR